MILIIWHIFLIDQAEIPATLTHSRPDFLLLAAVSCSSEIIRQIANTLGELRREPARAGGQLSARPAAATASTRSEQIV